MNISKEIKQGEPARFAKAIRQAKYPSYRTRKLNEHEIEQMETQHNFCADWNLVEVELEFDCSRVRHCTFSGLVRLPLFFGNVMGSDGIPFPTGLYHSDVHNALIENCHISHVGLISNQVISQSAILRNVGSVSHLGLSSFGQGQIAVLGSETGERKVALFAEMSHEQVLESLELIKDRIEWNFYQESLKEFIPQLECEMGFIGKGALLANTSCIRNSWIGASTRIDGATKVQNSCVLSAMEQPSVIKDGAIVEDSLLQWGVKVKSNAQVRNSLMLEASSASVGAKVQHSVVGSNSHIQQGELSHSFLGPFVGFHHQSMLIAALWPEGMGNIAHGACVGSNHTGRKPNQELRPGKGMFFGLGCLVSFPGNYSEAPWSLVATGVHLPPQKVDFPMSLFVNFERGVKIIPGWVSGNNAYALLRGEEKFKKRNQTKRSLVATEVFSEELASQVAKSLDQLESVSKIKDQYSGAEIMGLGRCLLSEADRQKAVLYYRSFLERCFYLFLINAAERQKDRLHGESRTRKILTTDLLRDLARRFDVPEHLLLAIKRFRSVEKTYLERAGIALRTERQRGLEVHQDYLIANPDEPESESFLLKQYETAKVRVRELLSSLKST